MSWGITTTDVFGKQLFVLTARYSRASIRNAIRQINTIIRSVHIFNDAELNHDYQRAFDFTFDTTMVATGETRSKLFYKRKLIGRGTVFRYGYKSTTNDQSVAQEFDDGPVHRSDKAHFTFDEDNKGIAKCSRKPEDLYSQFGKRYTHNPKARRKAMATSIERIFLTKVRFATKSGGNLFYNPSFSSYIIRRSLRTARFLKTIGVS